VDRRDWRVAKADLVKNNKNDLKKYFKQSFPTYYIQL
jgi:hypothetical protein